MSEFAPAAVPQTTPVGRDEKALTAPEIDAVLADFRAWLTQTPASAAGESPASDPPDLHTLLGQMTALRQEVNLQTRAARSQQEQNAEALRQLSEALGALRRHEEAAKGQADRARDEVLRPLLKTLVELHDALSLARREVQRVEAAMAAALEAFTAAPPPAASAPPRRSLWSRLFGRGPVAPPPNEAAQRGCEAAAMAAERVRQFFGSALTGYTMSLQRVERALGQHGLEAIPAVGEPFDPELMEAVEVVTEVGRSATEVVEEVRRGYRWRERVFRAAQVKVARP